MDKKPLKINFENVNFTFEGLDIDEFRLKNISTQIFEILDEKIKKEYRKNIISEKINLGDLSTPAITISGDMTNREIADKIATNISHKIKESLP